MFWKKDSVTFLKGMPEMPLVQRTCASISNTVIGPLIPFHQACRSCHGKFCTHATGSTLLDSRTWDSNSSTHQSAVLVMINPIDTKLGYSPSVLENGYPFLFICISLDHARNIPIYHW